MGLLDKFKKKNNDSSPKIEDMTPEELKKERINAEKKLFELWKESFELIDFKKHIEEMGQKIPTHFIYKDVKNIKEYELREYALHYSMIEEYQTCIDYCNQGLAINQESPYLLYLRGRTFSDMGQFKNAMDDLARAIKLRDDFGDAWYEVGVIHHKTNHMDDGILAYCKAQERDPHYKIYEKGVDGEEDPRGSFPKETQTLTEEGVKIVMKYLEDKPEQIELILTGFFPICAEKKLMPEYLNPPPYNIRAMIQCEDPKLMEDWFMGLVNSLQENGINAKLKHNNDSDEIQITDNTSGEWLPAVVFIPENS